MPSSQKFSARMLGGAFVSLVLSMAAAGAAEVQPARIYLHRNWQIQSSCEVKAAGEQISSAGFDAKSWHKADVPATVVGALVTDKTYLDPNYGTNLKSLPGMNYSDKNLFANQEMPDGSPFRCSWWYRTEFTLPAGEAHKTEWLNFLGINYRANIWINGQKVADANDVAGTYRSYEFNVSKFLEPGKENALAVEVFAPGKDDLGITWVDWNPTPPKRRLGDHLGGLESDASRQEHGDLEGSISEVERARDCAQSICVLQAGCRIQIRRADHQRGSAQCFE